LSRPRGQACAPSAISRYGAGLEAHAEREARCLRKGAARRGSVRRQFERALARYRFHPGLRNKPVSGFAYRAGTAPFRRSTARLGPLPRSTNREAKTSPEGSCFFISPSAKALERVIRLAHVDRLPTEHTNIGRNEPGDHDDILVSSTAKLSSKTIDDGPLGGHARPATRASRSSVRGTSRRGPRSCSSPDRPHRSPPGGNPRRDSAVLRTPRCRHDHRPLVIAARSQPHSVLS
jgi:hypothetical protein